MSTVLLLFGGVSPEHEVAIVTALQVGHALKEAGFKVLPGYISKTGEWFLGDNSFLSPQSYINLLAIQKKGKRFTITPDRSIQIIHKTPLGYKTLNQKIDVVFPVFHGRNGEDGSIQGLLNLLNIPYVGCGLIASAVSVDKYLTKKVARSLGINVVDDVLISKSVWQKDQSALLSQIKKLGKVVFVKPCTLGSTIGITRADTPEKIIDAINVALNYDTRCLVESAVIDPVEVNISLLGNNPYQFSITEEPVRQSQFLSFADKYLSSTATKTKLSKSAGMASSNRYMPARISQKQLATIQDQSQLLFSALGGRGITRIDFMIDNKGKIYLNELNNLPGSLSFYLWQKSGLTFPKLVTKLVDLALDYYNHKNSLVTTFDSNILSAFVSGPSGTKFKS